MGGKNSIGIYTRMTKNSLQSPENSVYFTKSERIMRKKNLCLGCGRDCDGDLCSACSQEGKTQIDDQRDRPVSEFDWEGERNECDTK
jgi:hypothetical protein